MDNPNMLGIVVRSGYPDSNDGHYWCVLKSASDTFKIIDSMNDEIKELDKEWTLDFIQSYHEENDSYNQIKQFICVIMTESSYNCRSCPLGNKISYGYTYQDRLNIFLNEKKKAQETYKECAVNGCDFNVSKNIVIGKKTINIFNPIFCSKHSEKYYKLVNENKINEKIAEDMVINNKDTNLSQKQLYKNNNKTQKKSNCQEIIKEKYTKRKKLLKQNKKLCMARTWSDGCGLPCNNKQKINNLCGIHLNHNKYGLINKKPSNTLNWKTDATQFNKTDILTPDTYTTQKYFEDIFKSSKKNSDPINMESNNEDETPPSSPVESSDQEEETQLPPVESSDQEEETQLYC